MVLRAPAFDVNGVFCEKVYYVGDRTLDVDCAKSAGVRSVLYSPSGAGTADYVIRDLLDVRPRWV